MKYLKRFYPSIGKKLNDAMADMLLIISPKNIWLVCFLNIALSNFVAGAKYFSVH